MIRVFGVGFTGGRPAPSSDQQLWMIRVFGAVWHSGTAVITLCGNQEIGYAPNLGEQGFVNIELGAEPRWVGNRSTWRQSFERFKRR